LSDLAAMGAEPAWTLLALSLPEPDTHWLEGFARGFHSLADRAGLTLVGGDTVRGPRVVTVQALGFVPAGLALRRDGARPGDVLYASGSLGDAAAGLKLLRDGRRADNDSPLVRRYRFAEPRLALGMALRSVASAAIDVSDGLLGDLGKLCDASGVGAILELEQLPLSPALLASFDATQAERFALGGGDDYELVFTVPKAAASDTETSLGPIGRITRIGEIVAGHGVRCQRAGQTVEPGIAGYDHFG
jgi:thiamine-monophosphate kinase